LCSNFLLQLYDELATINVVEGIHSPLLSLSHSEEQGSENRCKKVPRKTSRSISWLIKIVPYHYLI